MSRRESTAVRRAMTIAALYAATAAAWVLFSDSLLGALGLPPDAILAKSSQKGLVFVIVTAALLFWLTERHLRALETATSEIHAAKERLERIIDTAPVGILFFGPSGELTFANDLAKRYVGGDVELVRRRIESSFFAVLSPGGSGLPERPSVTAMRTGEPVFDQMFTLLIDEDVRTFEADAAPLFDEAGGVTGAVTVMQDISGRLLAEERIRESEAQYRLLFEANPQPMWVYDVETLSFLAVNDAAVAKYGYSREEFLGMTIADIRPPEDVPALRAHVTELGDRIGGAGVWRHRTKDGRELRVEIDSHALGFEGRAARFVMALDVTERERAIGALRESEERYRRIVETAREGVWLVDKDAVTVFVNERMAEMLGFTPDDMLGRPVKDFVPPEERDRFTMVADEVRGDPYRSRDLRYVRADGSEMWAIVSTSAIRNEEGETIGALGMHTDITERKRIEYVLWQTGEKLRTAVEASPTPIIGTDDQQRITIWNPAAERLFGWREAEVLGVKPTELWPESAAEMNGSIELALAGNAISGREVSRYRRDGSPIQLLLYAAPLKGPDGYVTGVLATFQDVTEHMLQAEELAQHRERLEELVERRTEDLHKANEELRAATQAKSDFLANMSHELRTPMNSIIGFTGLLLDDSNGPLTGAQREHLDIVYRSARHLLELINGILEVARLEAGKIECDLSTFQAADPAEAVVALLAPQAAERRLQLVLEPSPSVEIMSDRRRIEQVLTNLIGNAIKFTGSGRVRVSVHSDGENVRYSVEDTGIGIAQDDVEIIFEQFRQAPQPGRAKPSGTGLGLSIASEYARLLGGCIGVNSTLGVGSTFTLELPLVYAPYEERSSA